MFTVQMYGKDKTPCMILPPEICLKFIGSYCTKDHYRHEFYSHPFQEDLMFLLSDHGEGSSLFLQHVIKYLPQYTVSQPTLIREYGSIQLILNRHQSFGPGAGHLQFSTPFM